MSERERHVVPRPADDAMRRGTRCSELAGRPRAPGALRHSTVAFVALAVHGSRLCLGCTTVQRGRGVYGAALPG